MQWKEMDGNEAEFFYTHIVSDFHIKFVLRKIYFQEFIKFIII